MIFSITIVSGGYLVNKWIINDKFSNLSSRVKLRKINKKY